MKRKFLFNLDETKLKLAKEKWRGGLYRLCDNTTFINSVLDYLAKGGNE